MKILIDDNDVIKLVRTCFLDGGFTELDSCDVTLEYTAKEYQEARSDENLKAMLPDLGICLEDVLIQLFKQEKLKFKDHNEGNEILFNLPFAKANLQYALDQEKEGNKAYHGVMQDVLDIMNEDGNYDATTCFRLLQFMLFKEIIYG